MISYEAFVCRDNVVLGTAEDNFALNIARTIARREMANKDIWEDH